MIFPLYYLDKKKYKFFIKFPNMGQILTVELNFHHLKLNNKIMNYNNFYFGTFFIFLFICYLLF